ncbi:MAG: glycosyltransferase [Gracilibacteraceae bacterium]|jgi:1,2-diacylglycerol 3-alpha-glucosyltransferase|nr:glycosyltransferase [Gracilibacteraceae bacterium]
MRIALFTEMYLNAINGVVTHVRALARGLRSMGHEVLIVTADASAGYHYLKDGVLHCPALRVRRIYGYGAALPISSQRLALIRSFDPDIIHIHTEMGVGLSGLAAAKLLRKPLVYTLHTMYDNYIYYISPRPFIRAATYFSHKYLKLLAKSANALIGPSRKCEEFFHTLGVEKAVTVIRNPVEMEIFTPLAAPAEEERAFRTAHTLTPSAMLTCFVGRLGSEKNVDTLIRFWQEAVRPEDDICLLIIGDGPALPDLQNLARQCGVTDRVIFVGKVEHEKLPFYYRLCKAYITASLTDTDSISLLEGMATGLPALQLYDQLNEDRVRDGENGFVFKTAAEMGEKLRLVRDMTTDAYTRMRDIVLGAADEVRADNVAANVLRIYQQCLFDSGRKRKRAK